MDIRIRKSKKKLSKQQFITENFNNVLYFRYKENDIKYFY